MMLKKKQEVFAPTEGALRVCVEGDERHIQGFDWCTENGLDTVCELAYNSLQLRANDIGLSRETGNSVTHKVCVRYFDKLNTKQIAVINHKIYDIVRIDVSSRLCYLYLSQFVDDGVATLLGSAVTYDKYGQADVIPNDLEVHVQKCTHKSINGELQVEIIIRTIDYSEQTRLKRGNETYSVISSVQNGDWITLVCKEEVKDRE